MNKITKKQRRNMKRKSRKQRAGNDAPAEKNKPVYRALHNAVLGRKSYGAIKAIKEEIEEMVKNPDYVEIENARKLIPGLPTIYYEYIFDKKNEIIDIRKQDLGIYQYRIEPRDVNVINNRKSIYLNDQRDWDEDRNKPKPSAYDKDNWYDLYYYQNFKNGTKERNLGLFHHKLKESETRDVIGFDGRVFQKIQKKNTQGGKRKTRRVKKSSRKTRKGKTMKRRIIV